MEEKKKKRHIKRKIITGAITTITTTSVLLGATFDNPQDLINNNNKDIGIFESIDDDYDEESLENKNNLKTGLKEKLKRLIYHIPIKLRSIICIPLWFIGSFIISSILFLLKTIFSIFINIFSHWIIMALIIMIVIFISVKILFPDLPLKKIFNKKVFISIICSTLSFSLMDYFLQIFIHDYLYYRNLIRFVFGLFVITVLMIPFIKNKIKDMNKLEVSYNI